MSLSGEGGAGMGFVHRFVPSTGRRVTLLLLHGTGGDEGDLLPLGSRVLPGASLLSPRGKVLEDGAPRFFRRLSEGVFDIEDLVLRTRELAEFVEDASEAYGFDRERVVAVGYSNGANIAASLLLLHPRSLLGALLLRPMLPLAPQRVPDLSGRSVLIESGARDAIVPREHPERLARILEEAGAEVVLRWHEGGHALASEEVEVAAGWLTARFGSDARDGPAGHAARDSR